MCGLPVPLPPLRVWKVGRGGRLPLSSLWGSGHGREPSALAVRTGANTHVRALSWEDHPFLPRVTSLAHLVHSFPHSAPYGTAPCEMPQTCYLTEPSQLWGAGGYYPLSTDERARSHAHTRNCCTISNSRLFISCSLSGGRPNMGYKLAVGGAAPHLG